MIGSFRAAIIGRLVCLGVILGAGVAVAGEESVGDNTKKLSAAKCGNEKFVVVAGSDEFAVPLSWIRAGRVHFTPEDRKRIDKSNIDQFLAEPPLPVLEFYIQPGNRDEPTLAPEFGLSLPKSLGIRGFPVEGTSEIEMRALKRLRDAEKKARLFAPGEYGFRDIGNSQYVLIDPEKRRWLNAPVEISCMSPFQGESQEPQKKGRAVCRSIFWWDATVSIDYWFDPYVFPQAKWERLDAQVQELMSFLQCSPQAPNFEQK